MATEPGNRPQISYDTEIDPIQSPPWQSTSTTLRTSRSGSTSSTQFLLQVPGLGFGRKISIGNISSGGTRISPQILFEEESEVIKNCGALSSAVLGVMKSFSTSDISTNLEPSFGMGLRQTVSEIALFGGIVWNSKIELPNIRQLDCTSRSCSTWVAVGDPVSSTSQLPSPQAQMSAGPESVTGTISPTISPIDFVRSVNKKVRQMYIRRRLLSTYRALERLSRSQLDLSNVIKGDIEYLVPSQTTLALSSTTVEYDSSSCVHKSLRTSESSPLSQVQVSASSFNLGDTSSLNIQLPRNTKTKTSGKPSQLDLKAIKGGLSTLTVKDIELQKGKPLTKYERNMMIFNWLQNLDQETGLLVDSLGTV